MPLYTYRREDGTTFELKQKFLDEPLTRDPETGQRVVRLVQPAGIIFKGSGFYVNDSKSASRSTLNGSSAPKESKDTRDSTPAVTSTDTTSKAAATAAAD